MTRSLFFNEPAISDSEEKWYNSPVSYYSGKLDEIGDYLPVFERHAFSLTQPGNELTRLNERLDTIVRRPHLEDQRCPVQLARRCV